MNAISLQCVQFAVSYIKLWGVMSYVFIETLSYDEPYRYVRGGCEIGAINIPRKTSDTKSENTPWAVLWHSLLHKNNEGPFCHPRPGDFRKNVDSEGLWRTCKCYFIEICPRGEVSVYIVATKPIKLCSAEAKNMRVSVFFCGWSKDF